MQMALPHVNPDGKLRSIATRMALLHTNTGKCTIHFSGNPSPWKKSEICDRKLGRPRTPIFYGNLTASVYWARSLDSVRLAKLRYSLLKQKIWPIIFSFLLWLTALDYYSGNVGSAVNSAASTVHPWAIQSCLCFLVEKVAGILPWPTWAPLGVLLQW